MIIGHTYPISLQMADATFTQYTDITVTFAQRNVSYDLTPTVISDTELEVQLTQEQSLSFVAPSIVYPLKVQVNYMDGTSRGGSYVATITTEEQLNMAVIE